MKTDNSKRDEATWKTIAILGSRGLPARYGGFETFADELAKGLVERGIAVTVFCESSFAQSGAKESYGNVCLQYVWAPPIGPLRTVFFDLLSLLSARNRFSISYMLGYGSALFFWLGASKRTAVWVNMDGVEWKRSKWSPLGRAYLRTMEWFAVRSATLVIADAEAIRTHLVRRHPVQSKCEVIAYGARSPESLSTVRLCEETGLKPFGYYLVVCRLEPENHVEEIIEGFVSSSSYRMLVVVGDVSSSGRYVRRLKAIPDARVEFMGGIYDQQLLGTIRSNAFAYFHGHSVGGTNPSLLEAMASGNVVIAHDNQFNREVLGRGGLFFKSSGELPGLIDQLEARTSREVSAERELMRRRVEESYSWPGIVAQYVHLLRNGIPDDVTRN